MLKRLLVILCALLLSPAAMAETLTVSYAPDATGVFANPLCGLAAWANEESDRQQPFTLVYANLRWADFEPEEGVFDFVAFESENHFEEWRAQGKRLILRFVLDMPGSKKHLDIPKWLFDETGDGSYYSTSYGKGYSPNYENPVFIEAHARAIAALAQKYGGDRFIAYVQLGSVGHWGEWHIHDEIGKLPDMAVLEEYVAPYLNAFPNAYLMARRPFAFAAENDMGLYNDTSGDPKATALWLKWQQQGGSYQGVEGLLSPMPEGWRTAPIGGEVATACSVEDMLLQDGAQTLELFRDSHTSWIGPHGFVDIPVEKETQPMLDTLLRSIGYRLRVEKAVLTLSPDGSRQLTLEWQNDGFAPFYFRDWVIRLRCVGAEAQVAMLDFPLDLTAILPNEPARASITLPGGACTVFVGIADPETGDAAVSLAMQTPQEGLWYQLMSLEP